MALRPVGRGEILRGDVGGERGDRACGRRRMESRRPRSLAGPVGRGSRVHPLRAQLEGESYRGHEGMERFLAEMREEWEGVRFEIEETRDAGEQVVAIGRFRARGRASGVDINVPLGVFTRVRRGKIVYMRFFSEPAEALAAAGLSDSPLWTRNNT